MMSGEEQPQSLSLVNLGEVLFKPIILSSVYTYTTKSTIIPAHTAAKLALSTDISFCFNSNTLPPPLRLACMADCPLVS